MSETLRDDDITLASFAQSVLNDCLYSVIHDLVIQTHEKEKKLLQTLDPKTLLPLCPNCSLPRLLDPPLAISKPDKTTQYCSAVPWSRKPGHDIYGNPFPVAGSDKPPTKKEREARARAEKEERKNAKNTPSKNDDDDKDDGPNIAGGPVDKKAAKVDQRLKDGTYIPWHTCPNCKRSLLITRFAQHLASCLGIGGRARNAARASMGGGSVGSGATPGGSRAGTPTGSRKGLDDEDEDSDDVKKASSVRKQVLKKQGLKAGMGKAEGTAKKTNLVKKGKADANGEKRDREEDEDETTPVRKKMKLQRQMSLASTGTAGDLSQMSVDADLDESVDGSFVNPDEEDESEGE
ncbi:hypothetical protein MBLNU457_3847t1 [Dothideomycetes sp. NU457]